MKLENVLNRLFNEQLESLDRRIHLLGKRIIPKTKNHMKSLNCIVRKSVTELKREKEEQQRERASKEHLDSNVISIDNLMVHERKEEFSTETSFTQLLCLKRKVVDIIPIVELLIHPTFLTIGEVKEQKEIHKIYYDPHKIFPSFMSL